MICYDLQRGYEEFEPPVDRALVLYEEHVMPKDAGAMQLGALLANSENGWGLPESGD